MREQGYRVRLPGRYETPHENLHTVLLAASRLRAMSSPHIPTTVRRLCQSRSRRCVPLRAGFRAGLEYGKAHEKTRSRPVTFPKDGESSGREVSPGTDVRTGVSEIRPG